jgi:ATP-dependent Lon protease
MAQENGKPSVDYSAENLPSTLPILPLYDAALFPKMVLPLVVMQSESIKLVDEAMARNRIIGLVVSNKQEKSKPDEKDDLAKVGCSALILKMAKTEDNRAQMLVQGLNRFEVKTYIEDKPYLQAYVEHFDDIEHADDETAALMANVIKQFTRIVELSPGLPPEIAQMANSIKEPGTLADMIASTINSNVQEKQQILETQDTTKRLKSVTRLVNHQLSILELGNKIQSQVKGDMDKRQREYYLRQQLKAIKDELGETDESGVEIEEYRSQGQGARTARSGRQGGRTRIGSPGQNASLFSRIYGGADLSGLAHRAALAGANH